MNDPAPFRCISPNEKMLSELLIAPEVSIPYIQRKYKMKYSSAERAYKMLHVMKDMVENLL